MSTEPLLDPLELGYGVAPSMSHPEPVSPCVPGDLRMSLVGNSLLLLAAALVSREVEFVVVGGVARALRGVPHQPADLDVAVDEDSANLVRLVEALLRFGVAGSLQLTPELVVRRSPLRVVTSFGPLDIFVGSDLPGDAAVEVVGGFPVRFASPAGDSAKYLPGKEEGV